MMRRRAMWLSLAMLIGAKAIGWADVYDDLSNLVAPQGVNEDRTAAVKRWKQARALLDKTDAGNPEDYRHCFYKAVVVFRLDGVEASRADRYRCTAAIVAGTRADKQDKSATERADRINDLARLTEDFYKAELEQVHRSTTSIGYAGKSKVVFVESKLDALEKSGAISPDAARQLRGDLEAVKGAFDLKGDSWILTEQKPGDPLDPAVLKKWYEREGSLDDKKLIVPTPGPAPAPPKSKVQ